MALLMDLVAGSGKEILLAIAIDDWASLDDPQRFDAHLSMGGAMGPNWLDLYSEAVRDATGRDEPMDFLDARREIDGPGDVGERTIERVDPAWITALARVDDREIDADRGSMDRARRGRSRAPSTRGEAVDPPARGGGDRVRPKGRSIAGRPPRLGTLSATDPR